MHLLKIEWLKLKNYTTFWLLTGLFAALFLFWNYGVYKSAVIIGNTPANMLSTSYSFPNVWPNMGFWYGLFIIFLCVMVIISVSNEFTYRTNRQHIIDGMERINFLHAKIILIVTLALASTLLFLINAMLFGFISGGGNPFEDIDKLLYSFIYTVNYLMFAAMIAFFIKRSGLSIMLLLAYFIFELVAKHSINVKFDTSIGNYLPLQCSDELLPFNSIKTLSAMAGKPMPEANNMLYVMASLVYIGLYYFILRRKMLNSDL